MWLVFGTKQESLRVPGGAQVVRTCGSCHETTTFYEKDLTSTFRLYFIDVFDYRKHRVMQCGACGAHYKTDELGPQDRDIGTSIEKKLEQGASAIGRAASTVGDEMTNLAAKLVGRSMPKRSAREADPDPPRDEPLDPLDEPDEMEMKFRALEAEEEKRKRGR